MIPNPNPNPQPEQPVTVPQQEVPEGPMATEPAVIIGGAITVILGGVWLILKSAGVEITEDLSTGVETLITGLLLVPAFVGGLARFFVVSPHTSAQANNQSAKTGVPVDVMNSNTW